MNTLAGWNRKWDQTHTVFNLDGVTVRLIRDQVTRFAKNCGIFHCKAVVLNTGVRFRYLTNTATRNIRPMLIIQGRTKGKKALSDLRCLLDLLE